MEQLSILFERDDEQLGYVYFMQSGQDGPIKIGFTQNVLSRFRTLHTSSPFPLRLLGAIPGSHALEKELHARFSIDRIRRNAEWFNPSPPLLDLIHTSEMLSEFDCNGAPVKARAKKSKALIHTKPAKEQQIKPKVSKIKKTIKTSLSTSKHLAQFIEKSGFTLEELSDLSGVEKHRIEAALSIDERINHPGYAGRMLTIDHVREIGRVINVQFLTGYYPSKNSPVLKEVFFGLGPVLDEAEKQGYSISRLIESLSDNLLLKIDVEAEQIKKAVLAYTSPDDECFDGVYMPVLHEKALSFSDIIDIGSALRVHFF